MFTVQQLKRFQMHDKTLCAGLIKLMERKEDLLAAVVSLFSSHQATTMHQHNHWLRMAHSLSLQAVAAALLSQLFHLAITCLAVTAATTN